MTKQVRLPKGLFATVDDCDYELVLRYRWKLARDKSNIYAIANIKVNGRMTTIRMHRVILGAKPGTTIDHINGNGLDNRRCNLRFCSHNENNRNRQKRGKFTSRYKGVYQPKGSVRWRASIKCEGVQTHLGTFDREVDAAKAYDTAARKKFGEFARTNF